MSNSEKLLNLIINDELPELFYPIQRVNLLEAEYQLYTTMQELSLGVADFEEMNDYCREIVNALDGHWSVLVDQGYGAYLYRHPSVTMKHLVGSMFFKKNIRGSRMAISDKTHRRLGELLNNTEMVLRLEALTKHLDLYFGLQVKVNRHISDEGYTTLSISVEFDEWDQTALFRCLFGPRHPYTI